MSKHLIDIIGKRERLEDILFDAMKTYQVLRAIDEFQTSHEAWENPDRPAREHAMFFIAHGALFSQLRTTMLRDLHLQVANILLRHKDSLHVERILTDLRTRSSAIKQQLRVDRSSKGTYHEAFFKGVTNADAREVQSMLDKYYHLIVKLDLVRDRRLAHHDVRADEPNLLDLDELGVLLQAARKILDIIYPLSGLPRRMDWYKVEVKSDVARSLETFYSTYK